MLDFILTVTITCYLYLISVINLSVLKCLYTYTFAFLPALSTIAFWCVSFQSASLSTSSIRAAAQPWDRDIAGPLDNRLLGLQLPH